MLNYFFLSFESLDLAQEKKKKKSLVHVYIYILLFSKIYIYIYTFKLSIVYFVVKNSFSSLNLNLIRKKIRFVFVSNFWKEKKKVRRGSSFSLFCRFKQEL
jgi:hypothetical protein